MVTGKRIGFIAIIIFFIFCIWTFGILTYMFFAKHIDFKFDFFISLITHIAWVVSIIWGSVFGKNILDNRLEQTRMNLVDKNKI